MRGEGPVLDREELRRAIEAVLFVTDGLPTGCSQVGVTDAVNAATAATAI